MSTYLEARWGNTSRIQTGTHFDNSASSLLTGLAKALMAKITAFNVKRSTTKSLIPLLHNNHWPLNARSSTWCSSLESLSLRNATNGIHMLAPSSDGKSPHSKISGTNMNLSSNVAPDNTSWMSSKTGQLNRFKISSHCPELKSRCSLLNGDRTEQICSKSVTPSIATSPASVKPPPRSPWNWQTSHSVSPSLPNDLALTDKPTILNITSPKGAAFSKANDNMMAPVANRKTSSSAVLSVLSSATWPASRPKPGSEQHYKQPPQGTLILCANPVLRQTHRQLPRRLAALHSPRPLLRPWTTRKQPRSTRHNWKIPNCPPSSTIGTARIYFWLRHGPRPSTWLPPWQSTTFSTLKLMSFSQSRSPFTGSHLWVAWTAKACSRFPPSTQWRITRLRSSVSPSLGRSRYSRPDSAEDQLSCRHVLRLRLPPPPAGRTHFPSGDSGLY